MAASPVPAKTNIDFLVTATCRFRNGISTYFHERVAKTSAKLSNRTHWADDRGSRATYLLNAKTGQCQRYREYEIEPTKTSGRVASSVPTIVGALLVTRPLVQISSAAPRQGQKAA